jgi:hypothetical protein
MPSYKLHLFSECLHPYRAPSSGGVRYFYIKNTPIFNFVPASSKIRNESVPGFIISIYQSTILKKLEIISNYLLNKLLYA